MYMNVKISQSKDDDGTKTQAEFKKFCDRNHIYCKRMLDAKTAGGESASQPADYFIWSEGVFAYVEVKHKRGDSISVDDFTASQLKEAIAAKSNNIVYLAWCKLNDYVYVDELNYLIKLYKLTGRKTIHAVKFRYNAESVTNLKLFINKI